MRLADIRHQERAIAILRRALRSGRMPHAYLFEGPEGVGKELTARALAARLLCADDTLPPDADACGRCSACRMLAAGSHPDFHLIHRGMHRLHPDPKIRLRKGLFLGVDLVRYFLIEPAGLKPMAGRRRVFVVRDAERMNEDAQNALLKTLEEPPGSACLILVTASASRLLPTIRSRCQRVPFDLLSPAFVQAELEQQAGVAAEEARALAGLSGGRLGVALHWHRIGLLGALEPVGTALAALPRGDVEAFGKALGEVAKGLALRAREQDEERDEPVLDDEADGRRAPREPQTDELRDALKLVLLLVAAVWREGLVAAGGAAELEHLPPAAGAGRLPAAVVPDATGGGGLDVLAARIAAVGEAERMLDRNVNPQLACERLGVALLGEIR